MALNSTERFVRSVVLTDFGGYEKIKIEEQLLPEPGPGEIEVKVHRCGMNFADIYTRAGIIKDRVPPFVLGLECSGVVTSVGDTGTRDANRLTTGDTILVGDRVVCYNYDGGLYREKVIVSKKNCFKLPDYISFNDGAAIFVNYLTAYFALIKMGSLRRGETVLVQSCAGGVGWAATQLAHTVADVIVIGTASASKHDAAFANGVKYPLEYADYARKVKEICPSGVDVIIENQGGKDFNVCQNLLKPFGRIIMIGANNMVTNTNRETEAARIEPLDLIVNNRSVSGLHLGLLCRTDNERVRRTFENVCCLINQRVLKPRIDSLWPLQNIVEATKKMQERKNIGKIILTVS